MPNYTRPGLKISVNRCYGVMNTNETFLVQIVAIKYVGGHERGTICKTQWWLCHSFGCISASGDWDLVRFDGIMSYKLRPQDLYSALKICYYLGYSSVCIYLLLCCLPSCF